MTNASPVDVWVIPDCDQAPWMSVFDDEQNLEGMAKFAHCELRQLIHPDPMLRVIIYDQKQAKKHDCAINPHVLKYVNLKLYGPVIIGRVVLESNGTTEVFVDVEQSIRDDWPSIIQCVVDNNNNNNNKQKQKVAG